MRRQVCHGFVLITPGLLYGVISLALPLSLGGGGVELPSSGGAAAHAAIVKNRPPAGQETSFEGGRAACRRCHLREYRSWERTPHADAFEKLPEENRGDPDCVRCHVTGAGAASGFTSIEETPHLAGVGCEACHGPGSLYKEKEVMESREASVAAGLLLPDEQTCLACHNSDSPNFPGTFVYDEMLAKGVHDIKR